MTAERSAMLAPGEGEVVLRGGVGVIRKISSAATGGTFSVVEHPHTRMQTWMSTRS